MIVMGEVQASFLSLFTVYSLTVDGWGLGGSCRDHPLLADALQHQLVCGDLFFSAYFYI
jgi:hypothetical protein